MNEEIYTRGLRRGPEVPLTKRRFVFDFWLPFLSQTNKFYILMEFDSNGGLGKRKNRSPESRGYGGGLVSGRARERGVALKTRLQSPSIFHSAASIVPFTNSLFLINWAPGLEIIVVKICLLKLWSGEM